MNTLWPIEVTLAHYIEIAAAVSLLPVAFFLLGLYPGYGENPIMRVRRRIIVTCVLFAALITWAFLQDNPTMSRGLLFTAFAYAAVLPSIFEAVMRDILIKLGTWGEPTAVLGSGEYSKMVVNLLKKRPEFGLVPSVVFDDDESTWGKECEGVPVEGGLSRAIGLGRSGIRTVIVAAPELDGKRAAGLVEQVQTENVIVIPNLFGLQSVWVSPVDLQSVVGLRVKNNLQVRHNYMIKRMIDYLVAVPATIVAVPIIAIAALWILIADGRPVFFIQKRRGFHNRPINVLKLRTMYKDSDRRLAEHLDTDPDARAEWERFFKLRKDPRVLPGVGHFLRKSSLDELPQLFNILRGEMTLVGPRPFPDYHLNQFKDKFRDLRATVPPGLTGLWQVSARSDGDINVQENLDTYYIRNWSLWLDFYILVRTVVIVLRGNGAY